MPFHRIWRTAHRPPRTIKEAVGRLMRHENTLVDAGMMLACSLGGAHRHEIMAAGIISPRIAKSEML